LQERLGFTAIPKVIADTMDAHHPASVDTLDAVRRIDRWAREFATELVNGSARLAR
jgi:1-deoxy-D-xylulose 5-phosphate reductoisomerase